MISDPLNRLKVKRGEDLPHSKLTDDDVRLIRNIVETREEHKRLAKNLSNKKLAEKFGVHFRTIDRITAGENWTHVD